QRRPGERTPPIGLVLAIRRDLFRLGKGAVAPGYVAKVQVGPAEVDPCRGIGALAARLNRLLELLSHGVQLCSPLGRVRRTSGTPEIGYDVADLSTPAGGCLARRRKNGALLRHCFGNPVAGRALRRKRSGSGGDQRQRREECKRSSHASGLLLRR